MVTFEKGGKVLSTLYDYSHANYMFPFEGKRGGEGRVRILTKRSKEK